MNIAINAGHMPGQDPGACGLYTTEADLVRDVALTVCEDLEAVGYNAIFIQENELYDICKQCDENDCSLFLSIHCNACNHHAEGTETFYCDGSSGGYLLASCVQDQLVNAMKSYDRGVHADTILYENGLYVLRNTSCVACLAELDFIDNPEREAYLNAHIEEMGHALARGITDYFKEVL